MSYTKQGRTISGADITIDQPASGMTNFMDKVAGGMNEGLAAQSQQSKQMAEQEQIKYYNTLREAGYSPDEATARVNKGRGGSLMDRIMQRKNQFEAPPQDSVSRKQKSDSANLGLVKAKTQYLQQGGKRAQLDQLTAPQIQQRLNYLSTNASDDEEADKQEISYLSGRLKKLSGFQKKYTLGQVIKHEDGKKYKVVGISDPTDPDVEEVPANA